MGNERLGEQEKTKETWKGRMEVEAQFPVSAPYSSAHSSLIPHNGSLERPCGWETAKWGTHPGNVKPTSP